MRRGHWLIVGYCAYLLLPVYWLVNMALRSNRDIVGGLEIVPGRPTLANFAEIVTNPVWYEGFANSLTYVRTASESRRSRTAMPASIP